MLPLLPILHICFTSACSLALNPHDDISFFRVLNTPPRRTGGVVKDRIVDRMEEVVVTMLQQQQQEREGEAEHAGGGGSSRRVLQAQVRCT